MGTIPASTDRKPRSLAEAARSASHVLARLSRERKDAVLLNLADVLVRETPSILLANAEDLQAARQAGLPSAKLRRLELTSQSLVAMADGLRQVAALPDPVGRVVKRWTVPSGLEVSKIGCPLGVVLMIYEARPNVTVDAFALCFKAGNACLLKGGREARHSNEALGTLIQESLRRERVPAAALTLFATSERAALEELLGMDDLIDLCIPRGGVALIQFVHKHARIPTVQHFHGVCHIYVDGAADLGQAVEICASAKTSAPATCNAAECLLVDEEVADAFVPRLLSRLVSDGVEVRGDAATLALAPDELPAGGADLIRPATEDDWGHEFLDLVIAVRVVKGLEEALDHIEHHASGHTEAIVSQDPTVQEEFLARVSSSCALVNASTRFNDGFQLGLGAEIGISTSKVHAYGPMGLEELTAQRYVVRGAGQVR